MYIVSDKATKELIHVNPAPLTQRLADKEIYFKFDPDTMEIGKTDGSLPEHFEISESGDIVELTLRKKVEAGLIILRPDEKLAGEQIVKKTPSEQVADGLMTLSPTQKITGEGVNEEIVDKTLSEQVAEGLRQLRPNQKVVGEEIVEKTIPEMLKDGSITLDEVKQRKVQYFSDLAFQKRETVVPDYKLQNALFGIYDAQTTANYKATIEAFRAEFYRLKAFVEQAKTLEKLDAITENFPKEIVAAP
jgi:hypothetical protein